IISPPFASLSFFAATSHHAQASVSLYQAAVKADGNALHLWSFDGADATARQNDGVGTNDLTPTSYGTVGTPVAPTFGGGYDTSSSAVTITRSGSSGSAFLTSSSITLPSTVSYEAIVRSDGIGSGSAGYMFAAINGGNRNYFTILNDTGKQFVTASGNSFNNQSTLVSNPGTTDWYYIAVTLSYNGSSQTTVNAWSANLTAGTPLVQTATNEVKNGSFISATQYGVGALSNSGSLQESFPGEIDEIALYSGIKTQAFFEANRALIVPEPS
ncbi:unnamed protein product, partial [Laminaria digitata]